MIKDERGVALLDLLVVVAIGAVIAAGAGMTTVQVLEVTRRSGEYSTTIRQSQNAGAWFSQDLLMARTVSTDDDPVTPGFEFMIAGWKDWETGDMYEVRYLWPVTRPARRKGCRGNRPYVTSTE